MFSTPGNIARPPIFGYTFSFEMRPANIELQDRKISLATFRVAGKNIGGD